MTRPLRAHGRPVPMLPARLRLLAVLLAAAFVAPAAAAPPPDLYVVEGRDWRVVLPVSVLAAHRLPERPMPPILLWEEGKEVWVEHFLSRYRPRRPALLRPPPADRPDPVVFPARSRKRPAKVTRLAGSPGALTLSLVEQLVPATTEDGTGPTVFLVGADDYPMALLAAVAAGAEKGVLLPVGPGAVSLEDALSFASTHRSPLVWCGKADAAAAVQATDEGMPLEVVSTREGLVARATAVLKERRDHDTPAHLVVTNPADTKGWFSPPHLSVLAPAFALGRNASLILSGEKPDDIERRLGRFERRYGPVTHVTLVGDYLALGMRELDDPDQVHRGKKNPRRFKVPLLAGVVDLNPAEYAVGRLAAEDAFDLSLQVARILAPVRGAPRSEQPVLMLSNADLKFIMAEIISMATVKEMENVGLPVKAWYGARVDRELVRRELPGKDVIIWEGHPRDLTVDYEIGVVDQKLDASLVFLQGCYTLDRNDPYVLVHQGAAAVIGTYMAVYSASGSAFAKTFVDALLYYGADQGEAMLHARNYLLAYVELKKRRGHSDWRKTYRAALSFDLWGDPTAKPLRPAQRPERGPVRLVRDGDRLSFRLPPERWERMSAGRYTLSLSPGAQLGSIYTKDDEAWGDERRIQELYFGWIDLPEHAEPPILKSHLPDRDWASIWSPKRRRLYLLVHNKATRTVGPQGIQFEIAAPKVEAAPEAGSESESAARDAASGG